MENIKVGKVELLETLKANRAAHRKIFEEAVEGYKTKAVDILKEHIKRIKNGGLEQVYVQLPLPQDQTRDYDRAIKMLEMSVDAIVELSETDFASYVMDDWHWKRQFLVSNSAYSGTAAAFLAKS